MEAKRKNETTTKRTARGGKSRQQLQCKNPRVREKTRMRVKKQRRQLL